MVKVKMITTYEIKFTKEEELLIKSFGGEVLIYRDSEILEYFDSILPQREVGEYIYNHILRWANTASYYDYSPTNERMKKLKTLISKDVK